VLAAFPEHEARPTRLAPFGLRFEAGDGPDRQVAATSEVSFARGWFEIQDEGSQLVAGLAAVEPGDQVLDYCAGGGGKTLAFAAAMNNNGHIYAYDADRRRLAPMVERLRRAGAEIVDIRERAADLSGLEGRIDRVLIDAPCTGTGTWRRRPDAKWRISKKNISDRIADQDKVLDAASVYVRPVGNSLMSPVPCFPRKTLIGPQPLSPDTRSLKLSSWIRVGAFASPIPRSLRRLRPVARV
jgi:16S rRNA (cytosine967-C5)-methyltransferase